jgi:hypothetical protein
MDNEDYTFDIQKFIELSSLSNKKETSNNNITNKSLFG